MWPKRDKKKEERNGIGIKVKINAWEGTGRRQQCLSGKCLDCEALSLTGKGKIKYLTFVKGIKV